MGRLHTEEYTAPATQALTNEECVICMEQFRIAESFTRLPCDPRHVFHTDCISTWLSRSDRCPMCKAEITKSSLVDMIAIRS